MLLKRLANQMPLYLSALLPTLDEAGLKTTENIIFTSPSHLLDLLPDVDDAALEELIAYCLLISAPPGVEGDNALEQLDSIKASWGGFGVGGVDEIVGEDWDGLGVVELAGMRRVGKSLLALHAVCRRLVSDPKAKCRWLDTEGSFSPARAKSVVESLGIEDVIPVLDRLVVSPCFRLDPDLFDALGSIMSEEEGQGSESTKMLVVDPITNLFKDNLTNQTSQGHAAMITVMEEIAELTFDRGLTTIIANATASSVPVNPFSTFSTTTVKPALGSAFSYGADITLLIQETGRVFGLVDEEERERIRKKPGLRAVVEVMKSRISPGGKWAVFETDGTRLYNVVPPPLEDERTSKMSAGLPTGVARPMHGPLAQTVIP